MDTTKWSYEKVKKQFPLGSEFTLRDIERYIIGYAKGKYNDNYLILYAYKENNNGTHNIYEWFKSRYDAIKDLKEGMELKKIPNNRHCGPVTPSKVIITKRSYKWIKMKG